VYSAVLITYISRFMGLSKLQIKGSLDSYTDDTELIVIDDTQGRTGPQKNRDFTR